MRHTLMNLGNTIRFYLKNEHLCLCTKFMHLQSTYPYIPAPDLIIFGKVAM